MAAAVVAEIHLTRGEVFKATACEYERPGYSEAVTHLAAEGSFNGSKSAERIEIPLTSIAYLKRIAD